METVNNHKVKHVDKYLLLVQLNTEVKAAIERLVLAEYTGQLSLDQMNLDCIAYDTKHITGDVFAVRFIEKDKVIFG